MIRIIEADVVEQVLLLIGGERTTCVVSSALILERLRLWNCGYRQGHGGEISSTLRKIFPIHKNRRRRTRRFKVRRIEALEFIERCGATLRPIEHAMLWCWDGLCP